MRRPLTCLSVLILSAGLATAVLADDPVKEGQHFACRKVCFVTAIDCAKQDVRRQACGLARQDCEERCDVASGQPPRVIVARTPPSPYELCTQRCGLSRHSCIDGGNSEKVCEGGSSACEARCAVQHGITPKPVDTAQVVSR